MYSPIFDTASSGSLHPTLEIVDDLFLSVFVNPFIHIGASSLQYVIYSCLALLISSSAITLNAIQMAHTAPILTPIDLPIYSVPDFISS